VVVPHDQESAQTGIPESWLGELERLPTRECLRLLRTRTLGRVGFKFAKRPVILPVNYRVIANGIVFRTAPGTKLSAAVMRSDVAFEVDDAEADGSSGWSVLVVGHATELRDDRSIREARRLNVSPWAPGEHRHFVAVPLDAVSGRRFRRP
jgi:nitroimidazol reductase NimA-like FMN-containing flavoprotein (pyridoxamine 5'-phosphate oxidase superfamily)